MSLPERLTVAERDCLAKGLRLTGQRRLVLEELLQAGRVLGAYDLIELLAKRLGKRMAPVTIYRALDFLVEAGLVHRIESRNAFLACPAGHAHHPNAVFLICDCCGRVAEAASAGIESEIAALAAKTGFFTKSRVIEMTGLCAECAPPAP